MIKRRLRISALLVLAALLLPLLFSACNLPQAEEEEGLSMDDRVGTSAAKTLKVEMKALTDIVEEQPSTDTPEPPLVQTTPPQPSVLEFTPTNTLIPDTPTVTPSPTITPSPTSGVPTITASIETNCRQGPAKEYPRLGFLLPGYQSTVHGRNSTSTWWYIENPKQPGTYCWVWTETTLVQGNTSLLPVLTPPPLPTATKVAGAAFTAVFSNFHKCGAVTMVAFHVTNTGGAELTSMSISVRDVTINKTLYGPIPINTPFTPSAGDCVPSIKSLQPGKTAYISAPLPPSAISNHKGRAIIRLCTEDGMAGACVEVKVNFTLP